MTTMSIFLRETNTTCARMIMVISGGELMFKSALKTWDFFQREVDNSQQRSQSLKRVN